MNANLSRVTKSEWRMTKNEDPRITRIDAKMPDIRNYSCGLASSAGKSVLLPTLVFIRDWFPFAAAEPEQTDSVS